MVAQGLELDVDCTHGTRPTPTHTAATTDMNYTHGKGRSICCHPSRLLTLGAAGARARAGSALAVGLAAETDS